MGRRDWVIVGLRLLGVWVLLSALDDYRSLLDIYCGWSSQSAKLGIQVYWMFAVQHTLAGGCLFFFAHQIEGVIYRKPLPAEPESSSSDGTGAGTGA